MTYGQVALIVSPTETFDKSIYVNFKLSSKMRAEDQLPELTVYGFSDNQMTSKAFKQSTDGFVQERLCVDAGEVTIAFEAVWGFYSSPFIALDNVTVEIHGAPCRKILKTMYPIT